MHNSGKPFKKDYLRMLHFDDIVFGPIFSRRLGSSLGVNVLPSITVINGVDCGCPLILFVSMQIDSYIRL